MPSSTESDALPPAATGRRRASLAPWLAAVALGAWIAISAFHPFTPALPQAGLDASWVAAVGEAADHHLRWGREVAFTYGPASPLVTGYFNDAYATVTLPLLLCLCLLFGLCAVLLADAGRPAGATLWDLGGAVVTLGLVAAFSAGYPDGIFLVLPLLPFLLRFVPGRRAAAAATATAVAVGVIGMAKMSFPLAALPLFLLGDAAAAFRRRIPLLTAACGLGFVAGALAYGQSLADLPTFIRQQAETVAGFSEAMALDGSRMELAVYAAAMLAVLTLTIAAGPTGGPSPPFQPLNRDGGAAACWSERIAVPVGTALVLLVVFKAGFVRQDGHTMIAWYGIALAATVLAWARWRPARPRAAAWAVATAVIGSALLGPSLRASPAGPPVGLAAAIAAEGRGLGTGPASQLAAAFDLVRGPGRWMATLRAEKAERWRQLAASDPLPPLEGSVDVLPSIQSRVLASGLAYRPRPSFQEYSTYTPALIAANRAFVAGSQGPDWVLFGPESGLGVMTLDRRYPNLSEGALWLDLLRLYRPERRIGDLVALRRRAVAAPSSAGEIRRATVGFDEPIRIEPSPATPDGLPEWRATWVRIDVRPSLLGRIVAFLFKPPPLTITAGFADGHRADYQYLSGIGASGFVLSPLVNNATDFELLAGGSAASPDRVVTTFSIHAPPKVHALLSPTIDVELRAVSGRAAPPLPLPPTAWEALARAEGLDPDIGSVPAAPPALVSLPVAGASRIDLGFGLALESGAPPGAEVVCFSIRPADGSGRLLWERCLERGREADGHPQSLSLALPPGTSELALQTSCRSACEEGLGATWGAP